MKNDVVVIGRASEADFADMVEVLKHYHFSLLSIEQAGVIDSHEGETFTIYNEVSHFDFENAFVARVNGQIAGCCHWRLNSPIEAKTTLISVDPEFRGQGIGFKLQEARMQAAFDVGVQKLVTFCDSEKSIAWYIKHFGYEALGEEQDHRRLHYFNVNGEIVWGIHFGFPGHKNGTKLVCDLTKYFG